MSDPELMTVGDGLAFGSIHYSSLQDIEIAVIALKELSSLLEEVYDLQEESLLDRIEMHGDKKMVYLMKSLLSERDRLLFEDGIDYFGNKRGQFINQCREVFDGLSPKDWIAEIRPERKSSCIPKPNRNSVFQDITYIDYDSCEDITLVVKVTKRLDRILRDQYCIRKFTLHSKVQALPECDLKRKTLSLLGVGAPILEERDTNNLPHREWYIKMARYVLYYLTEGDILNIESVSQQNLTTSNNLTESTFTIPAQPGHRAASYATYDMLTSHDEQSSTNYTFEEGGGRFGDAGRFDTSTRMSEMPLSPPPEQFRYPVGSGDSGVGKSSLVSLIEDGPQKSQWTVGCNVEVILHETPEFSEFIELWDIGGSVVHENSRSVFYRNQYHGLILHVLDCLSFSMWLYYFTRLEYVNGGTTRRRMTREAESNLLKQIEIPKLVVGTKQDHLWSRSRYSADRTGLMADLGAQSISVNCVEPAQYRGSYQEQQISNFLTQVVRHKRQASNRFNRPFRTSNSVSPTTSGSGSTKGMFSSFDLGFSF
eukprot:sb/3463707/